jgi:hypothetical protein
MLTTFAFVTFAWIFFRAENLSQAFDYIACIMNSNYSVNIEGFQCGLVVLAFISPVLVLDWVFRQNERVLFSSIKNKTICHLITIFLLSFIVVYFNNHVSEFIYFQF